MSLKRCFIHKPRRDFFVRRKDTYKRKFFCKKINEWRRNWAIPSLLLDGNHGFSDTCLAVARPFSMSLLKEIKDSSV
jgi:hypothetical protein